MTTTDAAGPIAAHEDQTRKAALEATANRRVVRVLVHHEVPFEDHAVKRSAEVKQTSSSWKSFLHETFYCSTLTLKPTKMFNGSQLKV